MNREQIEELFKMTWLGYTTEGEELFNSLKLAIAAPGHDIVDPVREFCIAVLFDDFNQMVNRLGYAAFLAGLESKLTSHIGEYALVGTKRDRGCLLCGEISEEYPLLLNQSSKEWGIRIRGGYVIFKKPYDVGTQYPWKEWSGVNNNIVLRDHELPDYAYPNYADDNYLPMMWIGNDEVRERLKEMEYQQMNKKMREKFPIIPREQMALL